MIKPNKSGIFIALLLVLTLSGMAATSAAAPPAPDAPIGSAFTYQGRLIDGGSAANGAYDLRFSLHDAEAGGAQVGSMVTRDDVTASDGYFTVELDFGAAFDGGALWLEVEVRSGASAGSYIPLTPRTSLAAVPYALGLMPGAVVKTSELNVPAITVSAPYSNSNALVATGTGDGYAVIYGEDRSETGGFGVFGRSAEGTALYGEAAAFGTGVEGKGYRGMVAEGSYNGVEALGGSHGVYASSGFGDGVYGSHQGEAGWWASGIAGTTFSQTANAVGVKGRVGRTSPGASSAGVLGYNEGLGASGIGVWGEQWGTGYGVYGSTRGAGYGVVGQSPSPGYAGWFIGRVNVTGTLSKGGGSFKIDHPLDPANKYLSHSFVESPDMMNIYNGMTTLDADGRATVILPDWFEALNQDFRYQLTAVGAAMPNLHVAGKIAGNRFSIAGGQPGAEVSWQVTGVRHDPFAEAYRIPVEEDKTGDERGRYLYPEVYGRSAQDSVWYAISPNARYLIDHPEALQRPGPDALHAGDPAQRPGQ